MLTSAPAQCLRGGVRRETSIVGAEMDRSKQLQKVDPDDMIIRAINPSDLTLICQHRERMFREAGRDDRDIRAMAEPFERWLSVHLDNGTYFGFTMEHDGRPIGGVGMMELDWPPHPAHPTEARRGYVLNVFVEPPFRGRGVARKLMDAAEAEFAARGISYAILHATTASRPLYELHGWSSTTEMAKALGLDF